MMLFTRTNLIAAVALASAASSVNANVEFTTMSKAEQHAFSLVAEACKADVQKLCSADAKKPAVMERHLEQPPALFPDFVLQPPPMFHQMGSITFHSFEEIENELDEMIHSFFAPPPPREQTQPLVRVRLMSNNEAADAAPPRRPPCPFAKHNNNNLDGLIQQLSVQTRPEHYEAVSEKLNEKGRDMMTTAVNNDNSKEPEVDDSVIVTARRLQEVTPDTLHSFRRSFLPFAEADCLEKAYQAHKVSKPCGETLDNLHAVRTETHLRLQQAELEELNMYFNLLALYLLMFGTILVVLVKSRKFIRDQLRLRQRILITIYSKPAVKRAVEAALGKSIGHVPPIGGLLRDRKTRAIYKAARRVRVAILLIMLTLFVVAPDKVLPFACGVAGFCFWMVVFGTWGKKIKAPECTCCCCGTTTTAAAQGLGDACCNCCSGTGVCSLECASCCNPSDDSAGTCACCGGAGCCCCCGCCCCGSEDGATTVKDSTGCCDGCTCCCCSAKKSANNKPTKRSSTAVITVTKDDKEEAVVYEGVPIMVV